MRRFVRPVSLLMMAALFSTAGLRRAAAQEPDSDQDGLSDLLEQALLNQFAPTFMVERHDCSRVPAEFARDLKTPTVKAEDGTIYGQVFPANASSGGLATAEIHFYHLWGSDCGRHGHPLDTEHVAVLVSAPSGVAESTGWKAIYWYAAAHENTVCDVSQIARASTLHAADHGARVWISAGKHASYLHERLCQAGCGADRCADMVELQPGKIVNLGEAGHPMNGSDFIAASEWPLMEKMSNTNFPPGPIARLEKLPGTDIAWYNAGRHPAQGIVAVSSSTRQVIASGAQNTTSAISSAGDSTDKAISVAQANTGNALGKNYKHTRHALGVTAKHVGKALGVT